MTPRILIVTTSCDRMGGSGKPTGLWAEELTTPWYLFQDAGVALVLASPRGGAAPIDPGSLQPAGKNPPSVERYLKDAALQERVAHMSPLAEVAGEDFDAIFFPGGHGTMWDLAEDPVVRQVVERQFNAGRLVAAVCHGPAGLVSARRPDGASILTGRAVNAFTDEEENAVGLAGTVPFLLESRMRELGGRFERGPAWQPYAVVDGNLITGQNPQSSEKVAEAVLKSLDY